MRKIRDPIHGFIELDNDESKVIDTEAFQRLRQIKQLSFAYLAYPGANHTRFEHSLGVYHVAGLMAECLQLAPDEKMLIKRAALLHDIGHGPFSHVSEDIFKIFNTDKNLRHEHYAINIIENDKTIKHYFGREQCGHIGKLITSDGFGQPILSSILSGLIDSDKQDYFQRDSYFCGVKYGIFDLHQLHRELCKIKEPTGIVHLGITEEGLHSAEQFILAKYFLNHSGN